MTPPRQSFHKKGEDEPKDAEGLRQIGITRSLTHNVFCACGSVEAWKRGSVEALKRSNTPLLERSERSPALKYRSAEGEKAS